MASGETKNQALYEQLAAACAENERAGVEHCAVAPAAGRKRAESLPGAQAGAPGGRRAGVRRAETDGEEENTRIFARFLKFGRQKELRFASGMLFEWG